MKKIYLILGAVITVLALIIAFENIAMTAQILILFEKTKSLFLALTVMFVLGLVAGMFFTLSQTGGQKGGGYDDLEL